jgi:hypothetical protein
MWNGNDAPTIAANAMPVPVGSTAEVRAERSIEEAMRVVLFIAATSLFPFVCADSDGSYDGYSSPMSPLATAKQRWQRCQDMASLTWARVGSGRMVSEGSVDSQVFRRVVGYGTGLQPLGND